MVDTTKGYSSEASCLYRKLQPMDKSSFSSKRKVGHVNFDVCTFDHAVHDLLESAIRRDASGGTRLSNAWCVVLADSDEEYRDLLNDSGRTLPDGAPVAKILRRRSGGSAERVRGPSFFVETLDRSQKYDISHFYIGTTPDTLGRLIAVVRHRFPGARTAGSWAPPFGAVDEKFLSEALDRVTAANPSIIWVGMGSPKQDFVAQHLSTSTNIPSVGVGAAFDFLSGNVREAPRWVQRLGLEWAFRLLSNPRRLWRRYIIGNFKFLLIAARR